MNRTVLMDWNKENKDYTGNTRQEFNRFLLKKWNILFILKLFQMMILQTSVSLNSTRPGPTLIFNLLFVLID